MIFYVVCIFSSMSLYLYYFFFFKQKTAYEMRISDWSSDVCSSDLAGATGDFARSLQAQHRLLRTERSHYPAMFRAAYTRYPRIPAGTLEIGRASCRERVCQYV